jgi:hypothetical protein
VLGDIGRGLRDFWWELGFGDLLKCLWAKRKKASWYGVGYTLGVAFLMVAVIGFIVGSALLMGIINPINP